MDQTIALNHNAADCIKSAAHFSGTLYTNICNSTERFVAYGVWDYVIGGCVIMLLFSLVLLLLFFIFMIANDGI